MVIKSRREAKKRLLAFEKEKGGVGSTGSLVTIAHVLMLQQRPVVFIEASISQKDVLNAYGDHHVVEEISLADTDASDRIINIIDRAPDGATVLANIPGGRFEEIWQVHQIIDFALSEGEVDFEVGIVWTMGLDKASRITLDAMLDSGPPGPVYLNLPAWHGVVTKFTEVDEELLTRIEQGGGDVFVTPSMPEHIYDLFRRDQVALDHIRTRPGVTMGNRARFGMWEKAVVEQLGSLFS